jgi:glycosyltransferase involved in cell wall biosynthesis
MLKRLTVSVVIPAYNEEDQIASCLDSVFGTRYPDLQVIVVDDNSSDKTAKVASRYPVKLVRRAKRGGIALARNDGIAEATGEVVAFVDADCTVRSDWLDLLTSHFTDNMIAGTGGVILTKKTGLLATYRSFKEREEYSEAGKPVDAQNLPGGNSSYRADVLRSGGGFDPAFAQPRGHEYFELGYRLRKKGYRLIGEPRAVVWHGHEDSLTGMIKSAYGAGFSAISFLFRYKMRELRVIQLKQIAFIAFLILLALTLLGAIPLLIATILAAGLFSYETLRAALIVGEVAAHYRNPKYVVLLPLEILLRFVLYAAYVVGLLNSLYRVLVRPS